MKRRDFVKVAAMGASPWCFGSSRLSADEPADVVRVGLIGAGSQGRMLLSAAVAMPELRVAAVCDIWPYAQNYARSYLGRYGTTATVYADYRQMLEREPSLEAILIATPDHLHAAQIKASLDADKHVYCEPMIGLNESEFHDVRQAAQQAKKLVQVGYQRRSNPVYQHVGDQLVHAANLLGQIVAARTRWATPTTPPRGWPRRFAMSEAELKKYGYRNMHEFRNWLWFPKYSAGPFCNFVAPQLDACCWLSGAVPVAVVASGSGEFYADLPHLDTVTAIVQAKSGDRQSLQIASEMLTTSSGDGVRRFEQIMGTEGTIRVSDNMRWNKVFREAYAPTWDKWLRKRYLIRTPHSTAGAVGPDEVRVSGEVEAFDLPATEQKLPCQAHLENFVKAIQGKAKLNCPLRAAWASHAATWAALRAVRSRASVAVAPA